MAAKRPLHNRDIRKLWTTLTEPVKCGVVSVEVDDTGVGHGGFPCVAGYVRYEGKLYTIELKECDQED